MKGTMTNRLLVRNFMTKIDIGRHEEQRRVETADTAEDPANPAKPDTPAEQVKEEQVKEQTSDIAATMGSAKEADTAGKNSPVDNEDWEACWWRVVGPFWKETFRNI